MPKYSLKVIIFIAISIVAVSACYALIHLQQTLPDTATFDAFNKTRETDYEQYVAAIKEKLTQSLPPDGGIKRDLFVEQKVIKEEPAFALSSIQKEVIPIIFKGSIVKGANKIIAQINWGNKTYFVKPDESVNEWTIKTITQSSVTAIDPRGTEFVLELNKVMHTEELVATVVYAIDRKIYHVKLGSSVEGFKVVDIKSDSVVVSKNNTQLIFTLQPKD